MNSPGGSELLFRPGFFRVLNVYFPLLVASTLAACAWYVIRGSLPAPYTLMLAVPMVAYYQAENAYVALWPRGLRVKPFGWQLKPEVSEFSWDELTDAVLVNERSQSRRAIEVHAGQRRARIPLGVLADQASFIQAVVKFNGPKSHLLKALSRR